MRWCKRCPKCNCRMKLRKRMVKEWQKTFTSGDEGGGCFGDRPEECGANVCLEDRLVEVERKVFTCTSCGYYEEPVGWV